MKHYTVDFEYYIDTREFRSVTEEGTGAKIKCIKAIRNGLGNGLKESKDIVELAISSGQVTLRTTAETYGRVCASLAIADGYCGEVRIYHVQETLPVDHDLTALL